MIAEKPITLQDIENMLRRPPTGSGKVKLMNKKDTPLDKHYKLLDRIIRSL